MNWNKYPFLRLVAALALGIALREVWTSIRFDGRWFWGVLLALIASLTVLHLTLKSYRYRWVHGVTVIGVFVYLGYGMACSEAVKLWPEDYNRLLQDGWCLARLDEPPTEREKTVKAVLRIVGFRNPCGMTTSAGKVMAYFQKTDAVVHLDYGDLVAFRIPVESVAPPMNPGEFDYKKYLERRGVTGTVYLKEGDWIPTGVRKGNSIFAFAYRFRGRMVEAMKACGITGDELGVGAAILLGYDESLPAQVRHNYVAAGAMHILCVSGMHVGIIYLLASFLLGLMGKSKPALFVKVTLLVLIWFYALITGLSPSIMRSALMISLILLGEIIHRKGFALNSIAASAFILLLIDPNNLFAIGFQLSYVAVIGIVLLQKWLPVSVSAQLATMPFTIYYFNQFTPYFWLSNLLLGPLSFAVILGGMLLLVFSWVPGLNVFLGKIVGYGLQGMNAVAAGVEWLPLSLVKGLYMNGFQFGLSLVLLVLLLLFVNLRKKRMLLEMLVLTAVFAMSLALRSQHLAQQSAVVVYSLRNHTAIMVVRGSHSVLVCDEGLLSEPSSIDYSLKGHWASAQLPMSPPCSTLEEDFNCKLAVKRKQLLSAQGVLLAFWDPSGVVGGPPIKVDYLLVRDKQRADLFGALGKYQIGMLLIDGSVPNYRAQEWMQQAQTCHVPCCDLHEGAQFLKINQ